LACGVHALEYGLAAPGGAVDLLDEFRAVLNAK